MLAARAYGVSATPYNTSHTINNIEKFALLFSSLVFAKSGLLIDSSSRRRRVIFLVFFFFQLEVVVNFDFTVLLEVVV
jgi:hypothetical protein